MFESILDQVQERIYVVGLDYRYRYANRRVVEFEGWGADEIVGRHVVDLVGSLIFKRLVKPRLDRCFRGATVNFQHWVTTRSGQRQYIDVILAPFREWDDTVVGAIVTIREKTAQKELQERFRDQADLHRQLIENSVAGIVILQDDEIVFANQAVASMFGYQHADEMLAEATSLSFVTAQHRERVSASQRTCFDRHASPSQYQFDGVRRNGEIIHVLASTDSVLWQGKRACQMIAIDITRQRNAERALSETAASFKDVIEGSLQGFFVLQDDRFAYVNQAFADLLGYSLDELKAAPSHMFYAVHERERMNNYRMRRLRQEFEPDIYEVDARHEDGRIVRLQQSARRTENWFGKPAVLVFAIDVTSRYLAEQSLKEERNLLRAIIDNIPAIVFAKDRASRFLIKNKAGAKFIGESSPDRVTGKSNDDYYPKEIADEFRDIEVRIMATGESLIDDRHDVVCPATGDVKSMSGYVAPLRNTDDDIIGIVGVSHDVTKARQAEVALRESEQRFKDIAEMTSDWFWELDAELRFSYFSERAAELSGTDTFATLGKKRSEIDIEIDDDCRRHFDDLENRRPFRNFRYVKRGDDGKRYHISISGIPIFDGDGQFKGYRGAGTNITREVETQRALAEERNLLRAIVDNIPDAIYAKDRQARFILKNTFDAGMMGAKCPEDTIGKTDFDYYPEEIATEFYHDDLQVIESGIPIINKTERLLRDDDDEPIWHSTTKTPLRDAHGEIVGLVGIGRNITEAKRLADRLRYQATHDALTDLLNRGEFERRLEASLAASKADGRSSVLGYIDLDQFKLLNDSVGHMAGDQLIRQLADLLKEQADALGATLARLGGDEFGFLKEDCTLEHGERIAQTLIDAVGRMRFSWKDRSFSVSISIGLTIIDERLRDVSEALAQSDIACYAAKDGGRNRFRTYRISDRETRHRHEELLRAASLRHAIDHDGLRLFAQPIVKLRDEQSPVSHYEILLRLDGGDGDLLLPGAFIPAAERYGLMPTIDEWVVRRALDQIAVLTAAEGRRCFSINLSGQSLADSAFQGLLRQILTRSDVPASSLCFEITETAVISNLGLAKRFVGELRDMGCLIALDDFGCGLSSFSYLKQFPLDFIKIDGSFIRDIGADETDRAIVEAINNVGHICRLETIAECVEDDRLLDTLRDLKVDYAQGLAVGTLMPLDD
ncbi:MAG: PAS domain S-box protein, partial [Pseudomonadota bacterium]